MLLPQFDVAFAEVVLVHAACFDEKLLGTVGRRLATMQKGSFVIAIANELPPKSTSKDGFKLVDASILDTGGFESLVHLYQKKSRPPE